MCSCDFDIPQVQSLIERKAVKKHTCDECRQQIEPGEKYRIDKGRLDGDWYESKTCQRCQDVVEYLQYFDDILCFGLGELFDGLIDYDEEEDHHSGPDGTIVGSALDSRGRFDRFLRLDADAAFVLDIARARAVIRDRWEQSRSNLSAIDYWLKRQNLGIDFDVCG
jgi:hypothetical protein